MRPGRLVLIPFLLGFPGLLAAEERPRELCLFCAGDDAPGGRSSSHTARQRRGLEAVGALAAAELVPWAVDRYALHEDFARISIHSVRENFRTGFKFDNDDFPVNQVLHPYHGGFFFNAARANGYDFWESGLFAMSGSLVWECCMENTAPSINDLVNTTMGGMALGEITHRLATVLRDNQASGAPRFWREVGATFVDPVGGLERLFHGEWSRRFPNPDERYPRGFELAAALGYRGISGHVAHHERAFLTVSAAYGDPFQGALAKPFDSFWVEADLNVPADVVTRVEGRGILKGRELGDGTARVKTILAAWQQYEYFRNASQVFGGQAVSLGMLTRYETSGLTATGDVAAVAFPLAGIQTVDFASPKTGRTYDYAPGAGLRAAARLDGRLGGASVAYGLAWLRTVNGVSDQSTLQFFRLSGHATLYRALGAGAEWDWFSRRTQYSGYSEGQKTQAEWRLFASWEFGRTVAEPHTQLPQ